MFFKFSRFIFHFSNYLRDFLHVFNLPCCFKKDFFQTLILVCNTGQIWRKKKEIKCVSTYLPKVKCFFFFKLTWAIKTLFLPQWLKYDNLLASCCSAFSFCQQQNDFFNGPKSCFLPKVKRFLVFFRLKQRHGPIKTCTKAQIYDNCLAPWSFALKSCEEISS